MLNGTEIYTTKRLSTISTRKNFDFHTNDFSAIYIDQFILGFSRCSNLERFSICLITYITLLVAVLVELVTAALRFAAGRVTDSE